MRVYGYTEQFLLLTTITYPSLYDYRLFTLNLHYLHDQCSILDIHGELVGVPAEVR